MMFLIRVSGISVVIDIIYGVRFKYIDELRWMNVFVKVEGCFVIINGFIYL